MRVSGWAPLVDDRAVLLVEQDGDAAGLVRSCLEQAGLPPELVTWVRTLAAAGEALADEPTCVLLDLDLPDAEGLRALLAVVEISPDTPVIVLTGRQDPSSVDALAIGAQDYLVKDDITPDLLLRSMRYAVERKRAQLTSHQLRDARQSSAEKARLERGLLPNPLLRTDAVQCANYYQPGRNHAVLGGDFFDVVEVRDGLVRAVIGDVMGHGPDQAALGVHLRVAWRTLVLAGTPAGQVLPLLAALLHAESGGLAGFVTACDATIDVNAGSLALRVAGHPAPLRCGPGHTAYLDVAVGPPLGVVASGGCDAGELAPSWPETRSRFDAGSSLVLYTDGLLDAYARRTEDHDLGIRELVAAVSTCAADGAAAAAWIADLVAGAPNRSIDDTAVVVITSRQATAEPTERPHTV